MPPKLPKGGAASKQKKPEDEQREEVLQAVVLADSYEDKFSPLTDDRPRCLLPLANAPLLDYTLDFLAHNGLQHVLVYSGAHADQVEEYLSTSRWRTPSPTSPFASLVCLRTPAASVGDALRDLDKRDLITGDFLLVHGDLVSNMLLEPVLQRHRARRERDRSAIMTMLLCEPPPAGPRPPSGRRRPRARRRRGDPAPVFVLDPHDRCLHYEELGRHSRDGSGGTERVHVDPEILAAHPELELRADLADPGIDLCAPDVLGLWSDNFDYGAPRASFLAGVLRDHELHGKTVHVDRAATGYAARVRDVRSYGAVACDVLARRVYPFAPDVNLGTGDGYRRFPRNVYLEKGVQFDGVEGSKGPSQEIASPLGAPDERTSEAADQEKPKADVRAAPTIGAERNAVIGRGTTIGRGARIADSCIGRHCQIGRDVTITDSHVWDGGRIEDGATVVASIIGAGAAVAHGARAEHLRVPSGTRVSATSATGQAEDVEDADLLRPRRALARSPSASSRSSSSSVSTLRSASPSPEPAHRRSSSHASAASSGAAAAVSTTGQPATLSSATTGLPGSGSAAAAAAARASLLADMAASAQDGAVRAQALETVRLELLGQRMAGDADDALVRDALALGLARAAWRLVDGPPADVPMTPTTASAGLAESNADNDDGDEEEDAFAASGSATAADGGANEGPLPPKEAVARVYGGYGALLRKMGIFDYEKAEKGDQVAVLAALERECAGRRGGEGGRVLLFALQRLYEAEVVQEEGVLAWWAAGGSGSNDSSSAGGEQGVRTLAAQFVQWLEEAESESESEDEEDD